EDLRPRRARRALGVHPRLAGQPIALASVARCARGDDVLPARAATLRAWDHVIDGQVRARPAVLTRPAVAREHGAPGDLASVGVSRHAHVAHYPDHDRSGDGRALRVQLPAATLQE